MPQGETFWLIGLGIAVLFGALRLSPHHRFLWLFVLAGWTIILLALGNLFWNFRDSHPAIKLLLGSQQAGLLPIAWISVRDAYRSTHLEDSIFLWERNAVNWDNGNGEPDSRVRLTGKEEDGRIKLVTLSLAKQKCPARFTPVVQSQYESLEKGVGMWITFGGKELKFDDTLRGEWRPVLNSTLNGQQYWGIVDQPIYHGKSKLGPDGIIQVDFPVGEHRINYKIEGESRKGCPFSTEGSFLVHIYGKENPSTKSLV